MITASGLGSWWWFGWNTAGGQQGYVGQSSLTWQPSAEVQSMAVTMSHSAASAALESSKQHAAAKDRSDDVEVMSSDSSSSSSSDEWCWGRSGPVHIPCVICACFSIVCWGSGARDVVNKSGRRQCIVYQQGVVSWAVGEMSWCKAHGCAWVITLHFLCRTWCHRLLLR